MGCAALEPNQEPGNTEKVGWDLFLTRPRSPETPGLLLQGESSEPRSPARLSGWVRRAWVSEDEALQSLEMPPTPRRMAGKGKKTRREGGKMEKN